MAALITNVIFRIMTCYHGIRRHAGQPVTAAARSAGGG